MLLKVMMLFLLVMVVIGMVGKLLFPDRPSRWGRARPVACPRCGRPKIGRGPCDCERKRA